MPEFWIDNRFILAGYPGLNAPAIMSIMVHKALEHKLLLTSGDFSGKLKIAHSEVEHFFVSGLEARIVQKSPIIRWFVLQDTAISYTQSRGADNIASFSVMSLNINTFEKIRTFLAAILETPKTQGKVYCLTMDDGEPYFTTLGEGGCNLIPDNYNDDVLTQYDHIIKDLSSKDPCGRVVLFNGEPGTGKTFLIRSLIKNAPGLFALIASQQISEMAGPKLIQSLLDFRSGNKNSGPIILIIEDADQNLVSRLNSDNENAGAVSALLNLSDGILGGMLDIRLICTTNAKVDVIDPAILRPGRLCRNVNINKLTAQKATSVLRKLSKTDFTLEIPHTIAEVYSMAKDLNK